MENFSRKTAKLFQIVLGAILGCLGFTGCEEHYDMYGSPTGHFQAKGNVTDNVNAPVNKAKIILKEINTYDDVPDIVYPMGSTETDIAGNYTISTSSTFFTIRIVCVPPEGSGLEADSVEIKPKYTGGDGDWNLGSMKYTADFKLNKKQD